MFGRLGNAVVRHPWWTIAAWLLTAVLIIVFSPKLTTQADQADFLPDKYESLQALQVAAEAFPQQEATTTIIVVKRSDGAALTDADVAKVTAVAAALPKPETVMTVATGPEMVSPNKKIQVIQVPMEGTDLDAQEAQSDAVVKLREALPGQLTGTGLEAKVGGDIASFVDNEDSFNKTLEIVGVATFVLIIVLILAIFRAPLAAILPLLAITFTMSVSMGLIGIAAKVFGFAADQSLQTIILIVLFGIGADYYLFLMFRYRERLREGDDPKTAMIAAVERVGEVISSAAAAVAVAFLVLLLAAFGVFSAWGPSLAIAVITMAITSLTLIPAVVSLLGTAVFWPSKSWKSKPEGSTARKLGAFVGRRPLVAALGSGALLLVLAGGSLGFKADYDFQAGFPQDTESAKAVEDMSTGFPPGLTTPVQVFLKSENGADLTQQQLDGFAASAKGLPGVAQVLPPAPGQSTKAIARVDLLLKENPLDNASISLLKDELRPAVHKAVPDGVRAYVGGQTAIFSDINAVNNRDLSVILPVAAILIALILALQLRSLVAPLYLVPAVLLGFAATIGSAVYAFQYALDKPGLTFQLPIILYLFVLAIGTDYNILMTARLREEAKEGHEPRKAAALAVEHGGPTVMAAGLILAGTFAVMMLAPVAMMQQMGFGVAIGIMLSAFVMSVFLVPGITALLGHAAWWPGHADKPKPLPDPTPRPSESELTGS
ncbi:RND superfamily putative drug exporter [Actinocorallia herbida]|uniref:RND superfamily putative drug exporter n=1 Tax=Actinocorallia herbida TaxID=58109 RepID=A0A3N1CN81_9ACTN|nr:MMPL family transporter [Actinocorallia herbida]ROO82776.1 RND superfamily putative drug exporter [Actinocorallia herbida]